MRRFTMLVTLILALVPGFVRAQEEASVPDPLPEVPAEAVVEAPPEPLWSNEASLSFLATGGNTDTQSLGLTFSSSRRPEPWGFDLAADLMNAEQDGETTAERYYANARVRRAVAAHWEAFLGASAEQDRFAGIDRRYLVEAGGFYHAVRREKHDLVLDLGLTWTSEKLVADGTRNFPGGLAGLEYKWQLSGTTSFRERLAWYPDFEHTSDWRFDSLTELQVAMTSRLALRIGYELRYRAEPPPGFVATDTTATTSLVLNF